METKSWHDSKVVVSADTQVVVMTTCGANNDDKVTIMNHDCSRFSVALDLRNIFKGVENCVFATKFVVSREAK